MQSNDRNELMWLEAAVFRIGESAAEAWKRGDCRVNFHYAMSIIQLSRMVG